MTVIKTAFDDIVKMLDIGDTVLENPGWIVDTKPNGIIFYSEKPKGTAEKVFPGSYSLLRISNVLSLDDKEAGGDPPCSICGENFPSVPSLLRHERRHQKRRGIGYAARVKRRALRAKMRI